MAFYDNWPMIKDYLSKNEIEVYLANNFDELKMSGHGINMIYQNKPILVVLQNWVKWYDKTHFPDKGYFSLIDRIISYNKLNQTEDADFKQKRQKILVELKSTKEVIKQQNKEQRKILKQKNKELFKNCDLFDDNELF